MKLKSKFSLLVFWIGFQTILLAVVLVGVFSSLLSLRNYQYELAQTRYAYKCVSAFTDSIDARGIDFDTMVEEWQGLVDECKAQFDFLITNKTRYHLGDEDLVSYTDDIASLWEAILPQLETLTQHYTTMSTAKTSSMFRNSVRESGISKALLSYKDAEDLYTIEDSMRNIREQVSTIYYANESFGEVADELSQGLSELVESRTQVLTIVAILFSLIAAVFAIIIVMLTTTRLVKRILDMQGLASRMAEKDFTESVSVRYRDEAGELLTDLNNTISSLSDFLNTVKRSSLQSETSGRSITLFAGDTATAVTEINNNIEELTHQFTDLRSAVNRSVDSIKDMSHVSQVLVKNARIQSNAIAKSHEAVVDIVRTLQGISDMAQEKTRNAQEMQMFVEDGDEKILSTNTLLSQVDGQLDEVSEIVTLINSVAEQTNLLSMNAAIESAHAGEAGKGFGVVAEEIRSLADSTGENAQRISASIYSIIDKVRQATGASKSAADAFTKISESAKGILVSLTEMSTNIENIDEKTKQLSSQTDEISTSAQKIDQHCSRLSGHQSIVSKEISAMHDIFTQSISGIEDIKLGTEDIVNRIRQVSDLSTENSRNMIKLVDRLDEFKTATDEDAYFDAPLPKGEEAVPPEDQVDADYEEPVKPKEES